MKNHIKVDGKLLQTNKKYSALKLKQKEKIHHWMYDAYRDCYEKNHKIPDDSCDAEILDEVMKHIEAADIWIPYKEVAKHYHSSKRKLHSRLKREITQKEHTALQIEMLNIHFSVCKVSDYTKIDLEQPFVFTGSTDHEKSLVCPTVLVPENYTEKDDDWMAFRIVGQLDFSLIGILARITKVLANNEIGVFAISTYDTDYVLTKAENYTNAIKVLQNAGYQMMKASEKEDS